MYFLHTETNKILHGHIDDEVGYAWANGRYFHHNEIEILSLTTTQYQDIQQTAYEGAKLDMPVEDENFDDLVQYYIVDIFKSTDPKDLLCTH